MMDEMSYERKGKKGLLVSLPSEALGRGAMRRAITAPILSAPPLGVPAISFTRLVDACTHDFGRHAQKLGRFTAEADHNTCRGTDYAESQSQAAK